MLTKLSRIRVRLTVWYVCVLGLVQVAFIGIVCTLHYLRLSDQLYHAEVQDMETVDDLLRFTPEGLLLLREEYAAAPQHRLLLERMVEVIDLDGKVLFRNAKLGENRLGGAPTAAERKTDYLRNSLRLADGTHVLAVSHIESIAGTSALIRIGYSTESIRQQSFELLGLLMLMLPLALAGAGLAGYRVVAATLDPLEQMARLTQKITAHRLRDRVPVRNPNDELGLMARVLNGLLERLESSFEQLEGFASDVSHELRTPLAAMRSVGEVGLQEERSGEEYRDIIGNMLEEVARLTSVIDSLLTIALAESGATTMKRSVFSLMDLVEESVAIVRVLAEERKQEILVNGRNEAEVFADRSFLRMAVINILDNAVKYSPAGSAIRLTVRLIDSESVEPRLVELSIEDQGPGIPEADRERVFGRFCRLDNSRVDHASGAGLGLPIAKWAVEANAGQISVKGAPGSGAIFSITMPVCARNEARLA